MANKTYSAADIIGKTLFAKGYKVNLRRGASSDSEIVGQTQPGEAVGVVYSYIMQPDGLWWQIDRPAGAAVWARHNKDAFDIEALKQQGVQTTEEKIKEAKEAEMTTGEKIFSFAKKGLTIAAIVAAGYFIFKELKAKK